MKKNKRNSITSSGFKIPENYFSQLDDELWLRIKITNSSPINSIEPGFSIPHDYFEDVEEKVLAHIKKKSKTQVRRLFNPKLVAVTTAVAASILLVLIIKSEAENEISFADLSTEQVNQYVYNQEFANADFAQLYKENTTTTVSPELVQIGTESLADYIIKNYKTEDIIEQHYE